MIIQIIGLPGSGKTESDWGNIWKHLTIEEGTQ